MTPDPNRPNTNQPNASQPNASQPYTTRPNTLKRQDSGISWGWIGGVAAVLILGLIVWSVMDNGTTTTATNNAPVISERAPATTGSGSDAPATTGSATTGSAPSAAPPPAAQKRETTGAAQ